LAASFTPTAAVTGCCAPAMLPPQGRSRSHQPMANPWNTSISWRPAGP